MRYLILCVAVALTFCSFLYIEKSIVSAQSGGGGVADGDSYSSQHTKDIFESVRDSGPGSRFVTEGSFLLSKIQRDHLIASPGIGILSRPTDPDVTYRIIWSDGVGEYIEVEADYNTATGTFSKWEVTPL